MHIAHTSIMKFTCVLCVAILIALGICGGVYALSGFNLLYLLCFRSTVVYRCVLSVGGVYALFNIYSLIVFKPFRGLK